MCTKHNRTFCVYQRPSSPVKVNVYTLDISKGAESPDSGSPHVWYVCWALKNKYQVIWKPVVSMLGVKVIVFAELAIKIDGASLQQCRARGHLCRKFARSARKSGLAAELNNQQDFPMRGRGREQISSGPFRSGEVKPRRLTLSSAAAAACTCLSYWIKNAHT